MIFVIPAANEPLLARFLMHNLPAKLFDRKEVVICSSVKDIPSFPKDSTLIADSSVTLPDGTGERTVISCGRSQKDTFTFSSKGEETASVALMRAVKTPFGTAEPMEIPMDFPAGTPDFAILAAAAVRVFAGLFPEERPLLPPSGLDSPLYTDGLNSE